MVDGRGRKRAAILGIAEYRSLLDRLEELEDALDLDEAVRTGQEFRDYADARAELKREGRL